ncbi:serine/threonine-protein kinase mTOR isoform X1 [Octopus bimaculoides]|uniref:Serine/threonine-protein kinase TOR n=1 Tax=Octopus bimaculoides TaxID=37653 RepID=A0A0L8HK54_OCTBM|nr:serine/threonine-protein kinase mTOR isoform X1 [Octopus bimaculoides]|eukprot:XP_014771975.1 PREDICTED: serine/threonine-protein kinase mTOR-like isoform X1 [Octopus bimaculoides]
MTSKHITPFITGLRSRNDESRLATAYELYRYVNTDVPEMPLDDQNAFIDEINHNVFEMVSSSEVHEKKGGILAIATLVGVDIGNAATKISRFANYLRNLVPSSDVGLMEMTAKGMGILALSAGNHAAEYVDFETKRSLELLAGERHEGQRYSAVLILKELATFTPTFFFQQVPQFFENIFNAVRDPKPAVREAAVAALRATLAVTSQRETKRDHSEDWYKTCLEEALRPYSDALAKEKRLNKDDWLHGSLLIINELLRCSNMEGERLRVEMEDLAIQQNTFEKAVKEFSPRRRSPANTSGFQQLHQKSPLIVFDASHASAPQKRGLFESRVCKELMTKNYDKVANLVHQLYQGNRSSYVQQVMLKAIPRLAAFDPELFSRTYLRDTIVYLLNALRRDKERAAAFQAVGLLAVAVKDNIFSFCNRIMEFVRSALPPKDLPQKKQKAISVEPSVFTCISMLGRALETSIARDMKDILDSMLFTGLSPALTAALRDLATYIPQMKKDIQDGLLRMLSLILIGRPLQHPGAPKNLPIGSSAGSDSQDDTSITLALSTLGSFDFEGHSLTQFVLHCAENYLCSRSKKIRSEAIRTCARLLIPLLTALEGQQKHSMKTMNTVADVLKKLLIVGITDPEPEIRYCVLSVLDERFDPHLAQAENLNALFVVLNDEVFEIRELAICIIGRLSNRNPAYIMPTLRKTLIQILTELEHSGVGRSKEQAARVLGHLASNASRLIRPYAEPILKVLIPKLKEPDPHPGVTISVLAAIGEQAEVSGLEMRKWVDELLPIILNTLQDLTSVEKREVSLWTLGQLIESTGYVVEPYQKYPALLGILLNFMKTEQTHSVRREVVRVLGILGALDPHKNKLNVSRMKEESGLTLSGASIDSFVINKSSSDSQTSIPLADYSTNELLVMMGAPTSLEDFYPAVVVSALMRIMRKACFSSDHSLLIQSISFIFKSLGSRNVPYFDQIVNAYVTVTRKAEVNVKEFMFQQLGFLVTFAKQHVRNFLGDIFQLIKENWTMKSQDQNIYLSLLEQLVHAVGSEVKPHLPQIVPQILRILMYDTSKQREYTLQLLEVLQLFGSSLDDCLHVLLPYIIKLFDSNDVPLNVRKMALETVDVFTEDLDMTDFASRLVHSFVRTIDSTPELIPTTMDTMCSMMLQLGQKFLLFVPMVNKTVVRHKIVHQRFEIILTKITKGGLGDEAPEGLLTRRRQRKRKDSNAENTSELPMSKKLHVFFTNLQKVLTPARRVSKEDWNEWLRQLNIELLKESPVPSLRSCWALAQVHNQLARDLLNPAFVSCWTNLNESQQDELVQCLENALNSQEIPEVTQTLLNLAEFVEHCDKGPLPLELKVLSQRAMRCRAYAKALHYKEDEFHRAHTRETLEALISINNKLQQHEAAAGVLEYARKNRLADLIEETWYEKLHEWEKALKAYEKKQETHPDDKNCILGRMRCLEALAEWGSLNQLASDTWCIANDELRTKMAQLATAAAWGLGDWNSMEDYLTFIPRNTYENFFYRAVFSVHNENYSQAFQFIDKARDILDTELTAMAGESYARAYGPMVNAQMLSELEEVIQYKLIPERRDVIKQMWWDRLQGCQRVVEDWQKIIQVRSLVISPLEGVKTWLKYASLCRKSGRLALSQKTLEMLMGVDLSKQSNNNLPTDMPMVTFAYIKHMWLCNQKQDSFAALQQFIHQTQRQSEVLLSTGDAAAVTELRKLLARCYLKQGDWLLELNGIDDSSIAKALDSFKMAQDRNKNWYKAWHALALTYYEAVLYYKKKEMSAANLSASSASQTEGAVATGKEAPPDIGMKAQSHNTPNILLHCVPAVRALFKAISLSNQNSLQDTLRLLTLWFDYGHYSEVHESLIEGIKTMQIENWLQVIPQLIARIDTPRHSVGRLISQLLIDIGKAHPQALIYPLTVASKSSVLARQAAANKVLKSMCEHSNTLVKQAVLVSEELIRVAILWHELWHEGLEEASRLYFGEKNIKGMFETLEPLHRMMDRGPQTMKEISFSQAYGRDLLEAQEWCKIYQRSALLKDLTQAWDLYYQVFRRITKQLPQLTSLELQYMSPNLLRCQDLELAVPGTYDPNQPVVCIHHVQTTLQVITSKQRPRKLSIYGSDGKDYVFLLKGHEDLRQDERVMQLFVLVNSLLANNPKTFRRNLSITRYAVIPLSTNSGLIGWVPHCDTLHSLIRDYREKKKILLNIEHRLMLRMAPDYDHLTLMEKVEVFEHALEHTQGDDLAKILWYKSPSSEVWFDRRTNYTRSLAVMSMVGYILGLGDRHPSNLMLDRMSGKIIHIDFGDCFEVAMTREKFPEKIPFRLTRMLINAMEVTGIDGIYRHTCESVMSVLREYKDSLMAVLEAFVYDPLLNWRLMDANDKPKGKAETSDSMPSSQERGEHLMEAGDMQTTHKKTTGQNTTVAAATAAAAAPEMIHSLSDTVQPEALNKKAISIINHVKEKLTGRDFSKEEAVEVSRQVDLLICQATSHENLCQCYIGWCPFW